MAVVQMVGAANRPVTVSKMHRRLLLLALPIALVLPACTDDDSPALGDCDATNSSQATTSTTSSGTSSTAGQGATSTTVRDEPGTPLLGPEGTSGSVRYSLDTARSNFCYRIAIEGAGTA